MNLKIHICIVNVCLLSLWQCLRHKWIPEATAVTPEPQRNHCLIGAGVMGTQQLFCTSFLYINVTILLHPPPAAALELLNHHQVTCGI